MLSVEISNPPPFGKFLARAALSIGSLGQEFAADRVRLNALGERLRTARCHLAVLGQFKRGKSTLINALVGESILPSAVVPATSIPTFVHGSKQLSARVLFDGKPEERFAASNFAELAEFLARFVTEMANPHNRLGVRQVEAACPAPILRDGLELIDTPGIGSTYRHNTEATFNFLPQCDAALFVVSADPPITEVEIDFLKIARRKLARLFFILNKADYLEGNDRQAAVEFLRQVLCEQAGFESPPQIFCTSAREGLAARRNNDSAAWQRSGMADIEHLIVDFLVEEKCDVLTRAVSRQTDEVLTDVQRRLALAIRSLQMPVDELRERVHQFEQRLTKIEEKRILVAEQLKRDEMRIANVVKSYAGRLLPASLTFFERIVRASQERDGAGWTEESARDTIAAAVPDFFEREFSAVYDSCEEQLKDALSAQSHVTNQLFAAVHGLVGEVFEVAEESSQSGREPVKIDRPFWRTHKWTIKFAAIPEAWIDRLFPRRLRQSRIRRRIMEQVEYLVTRNIGYLQWSVLEYLDKGVQEFRDALDRRIQGAVEATRGVLDTASRRRLVDSVKVAPEIDRLKEALATVQSLRECIVHR
ncbi:MAG TPA: dynamin family protein [Pirellulales bacterium]|jgi:GTP-binding protein EngB required for normal cell division|nr:dynamin family protein [Pirellulales bacterium]